MLKPPLSVESLTTKVVTGTWWIILALARSKVNGFLETFVGLCK